MEDLCVQVNEKTDFYYEIWQNNSHRWLKFKEYGIQTRINMSYPFILQQPYLEAMVAGMNFMSKPKKILLLGLGGGALVHYLTHFYPKASLTVVEKEKEIVSCAKKYFSVNMEGIDLKILDGFDFIQNSKEKFDIIFADIFTLDGTIPYQISNFHENCKKLLSSKGTLICNNILRDPELINEVLRSKYDSFEGRLLSIPLKGHLNLITIGTNSRNFMKKIIS